MSHHRTVAVLCVSLAVSLVGCGEAEPAEDPHAAEIARLADAVDRLAASQQALATDVRSQGRRLSSLSRDVATANDDAMARSGGPDEPFVETPAALPGAADASAALESDLTTGERAVDKLLATDAGRQAVQEAAAKEIAKRDAEERRTFVSFTIGTFARRAGLDERQTSEMQRIWKESLDGGDKLRQQFADMRKRPADKQPEARAAAMEFMRSLGRRRSEQLNDVLTPAQHELYAATDEEIVASLHGAPRRAAPAQE